MLCSTSVGMKEFLDDYRHQPALVMHWVIVGPSHQASRPGEGGVLRAYRECQSRPAKVVKSIVNTFLLANMASNPHTFEYRYALSPSQSTEATPYIGPLEHVCWARKGYLLGRRSWSDVCSGPIFGLSLIHI